MRLAAVSVDLDEIPNYYQIHGLPDPQGSAKSAVYDIAIDRLSRMAKDAGLPLTLFTVGQDLARPEAAGRLRKAHDDGFEIANHSLDHRYDLTKLDLPQITAQIEKGAQAIFDSVGERPVGFRAPGYTITDKVFEALTELGVAYDASVFPCPAYWAAKTAMIGAIAVRGRTSRSVVDTPRVLTAPTRPYRIGAPYWQRGTGLLEIPVQVTRGLRLPFIGTSVTAAGPTRARWLAQMCVGEPLVNLELHGIDVLDASDGLEELRPYQHDVRIPVQRKLEALHAVFDTLRRAGYAFVTMREAASQL
ncbi:MAG: polysaccharide deacetylase family protein [Polyangiaceae bacterium]